MTQPTDTPDPNTDGAVRARAVPIGEAGQDGVEGEPSTKRVKRDESGRFLKGNPPGPGNPHVKRIAELKAAVLAAVSPDDLRRVVETLVRLATDGEDVAASKVLMDRLFGKEIVAHVEHSGDGQSVVLILPANGTESGARSRTSTIAPEAAGIAPTAV